MISYVTYDADGNLTGCYNQEPPEEHIGHLIEVPDDFWSVWVDYRANAARDGLELIV